uniref:G patch domain-containing protein 8-like n=2 Tax=Callorhinchus milii TaxID=7868 RepID=A0A4W3HPX4_CALMI
MVLYKGLVRIGGEDYAEKEKAIAKALEDLKANFYCELCDKQYHKHQEFDNHINSYDHAHKQRLKELKQREFARNVASRSRKDEKKQEKALRRLHQLAELRRASECASGSGPMFKPTTVAVENQLKQGGAASTTGNLGLKPFSLFKNKGSPCLPTHKASVSFSFSKKAPLKLESSASVFNDTIEETNHGDELHCHAGKSAFETEMSEIPSGINTTKTLEHDEARQSPVDSGTVSNPFARVRKLKALMLKENKDEAEKEYYCYTPTHYKPKTNFPFLFFMKSSEKTDASKLVAQDSKARVSQTAGSELRCEESSKCKARMSDYSPLDDGKVSSVGPLDGPKQITEPFLPVLSRNEATLLQWPSELLLFTKAEPSLSYSCNPLYFDFKLSRNKNRENGASGQETDKEGEQNVSTAVQDATGTDTAKERNGSLNSEGAPLQEEQLATGKSKKRKNRKKSSKKHKSKSGEIQAENISKRKRGKKRKHKHKDNTEKERASPPKMSIPGVVEQLCEATFKEEQYLVFSQKRALQNELSNNSNAPEQGSNSEKCSRFPLKARNKRQKRSACNSLSHFKEACKDQKEPRSRLNLNSNVTESTEDNHKRHHKSSSRHSYEDDSDSDRSVCRKFRCYSSSHDSSFKSSSDSYSDTSSDRSRTSHSSRSYSDGSSDYSNRSRSRRYSKRHHGLYRDYKYHSRHKRKRHNDSSVSSLSSNDDHYYQRRNDSRSKNRGSTQTRPHTHTRGRTHSRSWSSGEGRSHSRSRSRYRSRSRQSRSRQQSSSKDYLSSRRHSLRRSSSRNTEEHGYDRLSDRQTRHRSSRSFSRDRVYHIRSPHYNSNQEAMKVSGRQYGTQKKEDMGQNYSTSATNVIQKNESRPCSSLPLKEMIQEEQNCLIARSLLEKVQYKKMEEKTIIIEELASVSNKLGIKLKDPPQGYFGPRLPPSLGNVTLLPLIGKLPATKQVGVRKDDTGKDDNSEKIDNPEHSEKNGNGIALTIIQEVNLYPEEVSEDKREAEADTMCTEIQSTKEEQAVLAMYQVQPGEENITPVTEEMSSVVSSTGDIFIDDPREVKEENPQMAFYDCDVLDTDPVGEVQFGYYNTDVQSIEETEPQHKQHSKSISPPLSAQPIIFTPEEMEKYGKLQLQAQQHIQQQLLAKQVKTFPSSAAVTFTPAPALQPVSIQQPSSTATSITTVHHTLLQHRAAATLAAALHPNAHHQPMAQLHHIAQPHITPFSFSPITHTIFPAHPAAFLAGHPLHFIPAAAIHPAHLTLHPLPHSALYPTLFAPHPAAAAASTIHLHPLLHPLISGHDLQHHSGPNT